MDEEKVRMMFDQNDKTGNGFISKNLVRKIIKQCGGSDDLVDDVLSVSIMFFSYKYFLV